MCALASWTTSGLGTITFDGSTLTYGNTSIPWTITNIETESGYGYRWEPLEVTITGVSTGTTNTNINTVSEKKESKKMRGLFFGFVVDPAADELVYSTDKPFVATDEDNAKLKIVQKAAGALTKEVDDYDIVILRLGKIRDKKEVQEVRVVDKK
jgi:hypothetical protein